MTEIKIFQFNDFQVNTFVIWDETKECVIIDPGCFTSSECEALATFIREQQLKPVYALITHYHIDHIFGNQYVKNEFDVPIWAHENGNIFWNNSAMWAHSFGIDEKQLIAPDQYLKTSAIIKFGNSELKILCAPGHADGSVCFYNERDKYVISGDVLFYNSIGRTDLPTGNYDLLKQSIEKELFTLPNNTIVFPGHGPKTTIGFEKENNPFL